MKRVDLRAAGVLALLTCLLIGVAAAPACASWGHSKSFHKNASDIASEGEYGEPVGVAVDEAGDSDVEAGSIYLGEFFGGLRRYNIADETVSPPAFFGGYAEIAGVAVNPVNHRVYVVKASEHKIAAFEPSDGTEVGSFAIPGEGNIFRHWMAVQIASDVHGNVYVPEPSENKVEVFNEAGGAPEGGVAKEIGVGALSKPEGVAVDPAGNIWIADAGGEKIDEFSPAGALLNEVANIGDAQSVAVDAAGDVFAFIGAAEPYVVEYKPSSPSGASVVAELGKGMFAEELGGIGDGIAVDRGRELVYVTDTNNEVIRRFANWGVATQVPSNVAEGKAMLHATLQGTVEFEAGVPITACKFEYGTTTAYGSSVPCAPGGEYTANTPVTATLAELSPGVDYHYRISAIGAGGFTQTGGDQEFGPPVIESESSWSTERTSSELRAEIDPLNLATSCHLQYVAEEQFKASGYKEATSVPCSPESLPASGTVSNVNVQLNGLEVGTTYHYRFVAASAAAPDGAMGPDQTFTTFAVQSFAIGAFGPLGEADALAGSHPYELTTTITFPVTDGISGAGTAEANPRDIDVALPPGLIGNPDAVEKCPAYDVAHALCSGASQVGTLEITGSQGGGEISPIYNLIPPKGMPAQFGARFNGFVTSYIDTKVRSGSDYGVMADSLSVSTGEGITAVTVTMWGVPSDHSHDAERYCPVNDKFNEEPNCTEVGALTPFLRNPTSCSGVRTAGVQVDSWQEPETFVSGASEMPAISDCGALLFEPSLQAHPTSSAADSPTGLNLDLHVPQPEGCKEEGGEVQCELAEADLKDAKVTLPPGLVIDPSSADHLEGCSEEQIGYLADKSAQVGHPQFTPEPAGCPDGAKLGTVEVDTPLVDHPLPGGVYVAAQGANPFDSMLALYIAIYDPQTGVVIKLPGKLTADPASGQLTATFDETPQLPFEDLKLDFFAGSRAALTTPLTCGSYAPTSVFTPWSSPEGKDATPLSTPFAISGSCVPSEAQAPNAPSFEAGTASPIGASYSPFELRLHREDGSQHFAAIDVTLPPGLTGKIAGLAQCPQAGIDQAKSRSKQGEGALELANPSCPAASEVGVVHVGTGSGAPDYVSGRAYFAGPYEGAPFSLVFITPALAGPFDLGTVVVRAGIYVDPNTTQVTVKSDPLPSILDGIPLDIRSIGVDVNRREFTLNPTSCAPMSVSGQEISAAGQSAALSDRFQAGGCTTLPFDPSFTASASAASNPKDGAALIVKVGSGSGQANIAKVHVTLPKQLPSRLTTLQKACIDTVFDQNPAGCPGESKVGEARASTPLLSTPLSGPAYFVSHGGAKFPELIVVLSGDGITVDLHGETYIDKSQITTSTFPSVPDLPVSSFELRLPEGPYSALDANGDLCSQKLVMPTQITGQNGAFVEQKTPIAIEGCKPEMHVLRHRVKGKKAIVVVQVPSAGTLIAGGKGLSHVRKRVSKAGIVTVTLRLSKAEQRFVAHHHGRRLMAPIRLSFRPARGGNLKATVAVLMR